ncbi:hypothetical protein L1N85_25360 [Paenibacillus alkaliterrae]|uniref:capping complex subunit for YIEGIA n=1 Tax=Paenibacillus alkaliterrae TaxID=320909 RepID=UPI001F1E665F|nr:hypothetical protein [Paenibacillus alkaliterrae]MCF2941664.1 hypothetical protein [Paenibacillus alkaliterrae]
MSNEEIKGILAYVTTDRSRYLGGQPLALLAKDDAELLELATSVAKAFVADIIQFQTGDCIVIKK